MKYILTPSIITGAVCSTGDGEVGCCVAPVGPSQRSRARRDATLELPTPQLQAKCNSIGQEACPAMGGGPGFECVDTSSSLEMCGACSAQVSSFNHLYEPES